MIDGGPQEFELRAGTENTPGIIGLAEAVKIVNDKDIKQIEKLRDRLIDGIFKKINNVKLNGSRNKRLCNNVVLSHCDLYFLSTRAYFGLISQNFEEKKSLL